MFSDLKIRYLRVAIEWRNASGLERQKRKSSLLYVYHEKAVQTPAFEQYNRVMIVDSFVFPKPAAIEWCMSLKALKGSKSAC